MEKRRINGFMLMMLMEKDFRKMKESGDWKDVDSFCKKWNVMWQEVEFQK